MDKISIPVACCNIGDILANEVVNNSGVTLVAKNTMIDHFIRDKLIEMEVRNIWVNQHSVIHADQLNNKSYKVARKTYKEGILNIKRVISDVAAGCMVDYEKIMAISNIIMSSMQENTQIIKCISEIKDADEYTYTHCINVALYSMLIAKWLNLPENKIQDAFHAGLLHDMGKLKISNEILNKNGKLTIEEFELIKMHPVLGYDMIKDISELSESVKNSVLQHHERIDGSGYPYGLSGDSTELLAKIISIADVYDAMTQNRVYRGRTTPFDTFEMFLTLEISTFDTKILNIFFKKHCSIFCRC